MKAWEICKEENVGKRYKDNKCREYVISSGYDRIYLELLKDNMHYTCMFSSCLLELDFEEVVDWSKVPVDTKILVSNCINGAGEVIEWRKRYFAKYENGKIYAWNDGVTSFSVDSDDLCTRWDFVKLYKEEK